jgi:hypothetical protein
MHEAVSYFDIFSGSPGQDVVWIEVVCGFAQARDRMEELAREIPGKYFVFSTRSQTILAKIDTSTDFVRIGGWTKAKGAA